MSEKLEKESIDGGREGGRDRAGRGEVARFTFTAHKAKQMRERPPSFLPSFLYALFVRRRKEQGRKLSARMYLARQHFSSQVR